MECTVCCTLSTYATLQENKDRTTVVLFDVVITNGAPPLDPHCMTVGYSSNHWIWRLLATSQRRRK